MEVQPTASKQAVTESTTAPAPRSSLDYDAFLQLLIAQMRNQDPTDPIDPTTQVAQLATFSQVEQAMKTNAKLDALLTAAALSQADGIIGRIVTSADGTASGEAVSLTVAPDGATAVLEDGTEVPLGSGVTIS